MFQLRRLPPPPETRAASLLRPPRCRGAATGSTRTTAGRLPLASVSLPPLVCRSYPVLSDESLFLVLQDVRGHRRRRLLRRRGRHPPLGRIQHPHARPLQDLRLVSPRTQSRTSIYLWALGFVDWGTRVVWSHIVRWEGLIRSRNWCCRRLI